MATKPSIPTPGDPEPLSPQEREARIATPVQIQEIILPAVPAMTETGMTAVTLGGARILPEKTTPVLSPDTDGEKELQEAVRVLSEGVMRAIGPETLERAKRIVLNNFRDDFRNMAVGFGKIEVQRTLRTFEMMRLLEDKLFSKEVLAATTVEELQRLYALTQKSSSIRLEAIKLVMSLPEREDEKGSVNDPAAPLVIDGVEVRIDTPAKRTRLIRKLQMVLTEMEDVADTEPAPAKPVRKKAVRRRK